MFAARLVFALLVVVTVVVFVVSFLKSLMGKPFGGTLHVPRGKANVKVEMFDDGPLRPFRYGQAFDIVFDASEQTLTSIYTNETRTGTGTLFFKGEPVGFMDDTSSYTQVLMTLASRYRKVIVQTAVMGMDADDRPDVELLLPDAKWFRKALREDE